MYSKPCPPQSVVFFSAKIFLRSKMQKAFQAVHCLTAALQVRGNKQRVFAVRLVYTRFECSLCMSEGKENLMWGGLDATFQSEWPTEENNKVRMTGTDGLLYCPLKCKLNIFAWCVAVLYIYFLPPVPLAANSTGGWHSPTFKTKCLIKGRSQMLIIGCLRFYRQNWNKDDRECHYSTDHWIPEL